MSIDSETTVGNRIPLNYRGAYSDPSVLPPIILGGGSTTIHHTKYL